ncbi:NAD(P)H-binding protein [Tsuneonella sp. HG222]
MTKVVVSGASGDMGKRITRALLARIPASHLTLTTRTPEKVRDSVPDDVAIFQADYRDRKALENAYQGGDVLMLISSLDVTHRVPEHRNAIAAAKAAGVRHIVYTSCGGIHPRNPVPSVSDHIVTERDLQTSGLGHTILRNQTYAEVFPTLAAPAVIPLGVWHQAAGEGRFAPVSKRDITACAVACLLDPAWHDGAVYEITGPQLLGYREIAQISGEAFGVDIQYEPVSVLERFRQLDEMRVPRKFSDDMPTHEFAQRWCSEEMVGQDVGFAGNFYAILTDHVEMITGKKPIPLREVYEFCRGKDYNNC